MHKDVLVSMLQHSKRLESVEQRGYGGGLQGNNHTAAKFWMNPFSNSDNIAKFHLKHLAVSHIISRLILGIL